MTRSFRHSFVRLSRASLVMTALLLGWQASSAPVMRAAATNAIVITQVYGGGGNNGATFKNDFIELFNRGNTSISLTGWSVQYASSTGTFGTTNITPLSGSIEPGHYYLIQEAAGTGGTTALPAPDATGSIAMALGAGKIALVSSTTALSGACPTGVVDFVGYGAANCFEGTGPTPATSNTTAVRRTNVCSDADSNSTEFVAGAPSPRNSASPTTNCSGPTNPSGVGAATPATVPPGGSTLLKVTVTPGQNPTSTGISVTADLTSIGGSAFQPFFDNGTNGDVTPNDNVFSFQATPGSATGQKTIPVTIGDAQARSASASITLRVQAPVTVVISQLYGGGANVGSTYHNDYVELYNASSTSFDLAGWTLQYASATGNGWAFTTQPIGGVIGPGQYLLVGLAAGSEPDGDPLPPAQIEDGGINMSATTGKIALVRNGAPLSGNCPLSDPDVVDFVGYGTSADCHEGAANAPAPSNTTALFRKTGGQQDTDENGADFVTGPPEPRQTAPIVEIGPAIFNTDPLFGADKTPRDASITLNFTEAVDVDGAWYDITCASTGAHNDATTAVANGGRIHIITPNTNFQPGESCTVTIFKDHVHDQDDDDSAPNTDTLAANYVLSFTVVADTDAPYPPDVHLTMGNPSGAEADLDTPNNYLMEKKEFALSYNRDKGTPNWVSWHLATEWTGGLTRVDTFRADPAVPPDWYRVQATDFLGTGFDRGHMTPNADRDLHDANRGPNDGVSINQATFLMTNMVPQAPNNNQGAWADFENYLRSLLAANDAHGANVLYIVSGPAGVGGTGSNGFATTLAGGHVTVPAFTWKVVLVLPKLVPPKQGPDEVARVDASTRTIAIIMPNENTVLNTSDPNDWKAKDADGHYLYLTTVDAVEALTGYNFFSEAPEIVQNAIEAGVDGVNPPGVANEVVTGEEDHDVSFTLQAVSSSSHPITFTVVTPPAHGVLTGSDAGRTYTPEPDFNGTDSFTFQASDGTLSSNVATVEIRVLEVNDPPVLTNVPPSATIELGDALTFTATGADVDGDVLQFSLAGDFPAGAAIHPQTGAFTWTPTAAQVGATFTFQVVLSDGTASVSSTLTARAVDTTAPVITSLSASPNAIWAPNHKLVPVALSVVSADLGGMPSCALTSITNNETGERDAYVRGPLLLDVLAERAGGGSGRTYRIVVNCKDASGNAAQATTTVVVPDDQGKK
jgi:DNA/RNA endonuclease G (NUC1)